MVVINYFNFYKKTLKIIILCLIMHFRCISCGSCLSLASIGSLASISGSTCGISSVGSKITITSECNLDSNSFTKIYDKELKYEDGGLLHKTPSDNIEGNESKPEITTVGIKPLTHDGNTHEEVEESKYLQDNDCLYNNVSTLLEKNIALLQYFFGEKKIVKILGIDKNKFTNEKGELDIKYLKNAKKILDEKCKQTYNTEGKYPTKLTYGELTTKGSHYDYLVALKESTENVSKNDKINLYNTYNISAFLDYITENEYGGLFEDIISQFDNNFSSEFIYNITKAVSEVGNSSDYFNKLTNRDDSFQNYRGFHHTIGRFRKTNTTIKNYFEIEFEEGKYRPSYKENDDYITVEKYYESNNLDRTNENTTNVKQ